MHVPFSSFHIEFEVKRKCLNSVREMIGVLNIQISKHREVPCVRILQSLVATVIFHDSLCFDHSSALIMSLTFNRRITKEIVMISIHMICIHAEK